MAVGLQPGHWDLLPSTVVGKCPNYPLTGVSLAAHLLSLGAALNTVKATIWSQHYTVLYSGSPSNSGCAEVRLLV